MQHSDVLDGISGMDFDFGSWDSPRLRITVLFTSIGGTAAALHEAARLASGLAMEIVLVVTDVVYFRWSLENPPVPRRFFEELCREVICEAGSWSGEVGIQVFHCRSQIECLARELRPRSLVVFGTTKRHWPVYERRLERLLNGLGHSTLLIEAPAEFGGVGGRTETRQGSVQTRTGDGVRARSGRFGSRPYSAD